MDPSDQRHRQLIDSVFSGADFFLIAGPCVVENESLTMQVAEKLRDISINLNLSFIFKASYRKANRSSMSSFTGIGDDKALKILGKISRELKVPVITDIHTPEEAMMASGYVDVLQIPAFLCRQTDLLISAAQSGKPVFIKKGQFMSPASMKHAVEKVRHSGNGQVAIIERGTSFGYQDLVVDFRGIPEMQTFGVPVVMDCTHSLQKPNQEKGITGGQPQFIESIARAAVAVGADGLFMETHPDPSKALSDGANMLPLSKVETLLKRLLRIRDAIN